MRSATGSRPGLIRRVAADVLIIAAGIIVSLLAYKVLSGLGY